MHQNLRMTMIESGWGTIDSRTSPLAYADTVGNRYGTLQKSGARVALSIGEILVDDRGSVMVYLTEEPTDIILRALIVEPEVRRRGVGRQTLAEIAVLADLTQSTIYLEPAPIADMPVNAGTLAKLYSEFGFVASSPSGAVLTRAPRIPD